MAFVALSRMESHGAQKVATADEAERAETTIEIKIKTLDSQTYTLRVDKQMPVPALKEQIASVTGVLSEQQRLICRGRVLKDDQLLSAYHVEDGHTLHMVVRQPVVQSSDGFSNDSATFPSTIDSSHVAPSVVIETFSMPDRGDGVPPEISRIVSAVLGSFGFPNMGSGNEGVDVAMEHGQQRSSAATGTLDATLQPEQAGNRIQSDRSQSSFGLPTSVSLGSLHPPVMPDALTTLSQYLRHLGREFSALGRGGENVTQADAPQRTEQRDSNSTSGSGTAQENLPTPASLAEVMLSSRQFMNGQVSECLQQLARQLESQANVTDPAARFSTQSSAWRTGVQLYNLGAFLLELGRTTMTLRLGQAPSEAVVNAGPAVFISPSAPNPLMVQPGTSFGAIPVGSVQPGSGLVNGIGPGFLPRRIDIQIRRGSSTTSQNVNNEERGDIPNPSGQRNNGTGSGGESLANQTASRVTEASSFGGEHGVRVVPIRTMVAAVPGPFSRIPSDSSTNSMGLYYPILGRFQHVASGNVNGAGARGPEASGEHHPAGVQNEQQSTTESNVQQQNAEPQIRDGSLPTSISRQNDVHIGQRPDINIMEGSGTRSNSRIQSNHRTQTNSEADRQGSILQLLRNLFPVGEIRVDGAGVHRMATGSSAENARTPAASVESQSEITGEGIFLSNLLHEIMPLITHHGGAEPNSRTQEDAHAPDHQRVQESSTQAETSDVGASHRHSDNESSPPNSKRQKRE
ncbi:ubiquitin-like domain-containing protein CIP73 isoform X2 [Euphorbia lathyris]|uniref:ubiquitin-like domain-containing protein CIP73 isoform X2 n=1 Tax=Euphorbia lathyris TaxID=212925 RepID=UPI0033131B7A